MIIYGISFCNRDLNIWKDMDQPRKKYLCKKNFSCI